MWSVTKKAMFGLGLADFGVGTIIVALLASVLGVEFVFGAGLLLVGIGLAIFWSNGGIRHED